MLLGVVTMQAQKVVKGSFSALANESAVSVKIDYTDSRIDKVPFEIFLEGEENWDEGYREILFKFVKAANQNSSGLKYLTKQTENYQLVFKAMCLSALWEHIVTMTKLTHQQYKCMEERL